MRRSAIFFSFLFSATFPALAGKNVASADSAQSPAGDQLVDRFIIKFRNSSGDPTSKLTAIGGQFGERLDHVRSMSGGANVIRLGRKVMRAEAREVARVLRTDARLLSVEPDEVMQAQVVPNDTMYGQQWHYFEPQGGINLPNAWDVTIGAAGVSVAIIDSGVLPHADLVNRLIGGYDFIRRIPGGTDPGDYGCNGSTSSWHGTHVAGTIGAISNNSSGVTGVNWVSKLVPVRVLGRCGGYTSDIVDGMRWAAGIDVPGVPANPNPVRVENLSLGGSGACSAAFQSAINDVIARGIVVVVAAGNSNVDAANAQPASCVGVIAVAATTRSGGRAGYSNFGANVTIAAPGGGGNDGVLSTLNSGTTTPGADSYAFFQGTSMATPHVSGVVSLMLSLNPSLTPAQVAQQLRQSARAFPTATGADCTVALCGAGIANAASSVSAVAAPPGGAPAWTRIAVEGQNFTISGTQTVRYGVGSSWIAKDITSGGSCTNGFFGSDPIQGVIKECDVSASPVPVSSPSGAWTRLAGESENFTVQGTQTVRYGSGSAWVTKLVSNGGACTNTFFGADPAYGIVKECDVLK